jgi:predicted PurR-regulated permease PerM
MMNKNFSAPILASYGLMLIALLLILKEGLVVVLLSGLLVYSLVHLLVPTIERKFDGQRSRMIAVVLLSGITMVTLVTLGWWLVVYLRGENGGINAVLQKMADIIDASRYQLPQWIAAYLPDGSNELQMSMTTWLREHANEAKLVGQEVLHTVVHLFLGMMIGSMVALESTEKYQRMGLFAGALMERIRNFHFIFQKVVYAQVRISFVNTALTAIYLVALSLVGVNLPLMKTMIAITFFAGLIPVVGNVISNVVIVVVCLSYSVNVAIASLVFMVVMHKLEYFLNARIIGTQLKADAWELLISLLVMETLFGLPGMVLAPIVYAYIKKELHDQGWV